MQQPFLLQLHQQHFWLNAQKAIFWEEEKALIIADVHFTKTGHFRKNGIGVPQQILKEDLQTFFNLINFHQVKKVIVVGDLFHSSANKELELFLRWRNDFANVKIHLIKGNHDILLKKWYDNANIIVHEKMLLIQQFCFVHDLKDVEVNAEDNFYTFSGHIHPAIEIKISAKQHIKLPCFYFNKTEAILPAFGRFTGLHTIKKQTGTKVFAIINNSIIRV